MVHAAYRSGTLRLPNWYTVVTENWYTVRYRLHLSKDRINLYEKTPESFDVVKLENQIYLADSTSIVSMLAVDDSGLERQLILTVYRDYWYDKADRTLCNAQLAIRSDKFMINFYLKKDD